MAVAFLCRIVRRILGASDRNHLSSPFYTMADEEPVDPKHYLEETCKPKCVKPLHAYQACMKRIDGDESGHKHCTGQYFDYYSCVDKCVAPRLFSKLK
ncbi:Cytochrome b-c1 complex subunit 6-1, mitochondrial-like protein [Drosera capensis]